MHERPPDIRDSEVAAALDRQWPLTVRELLSYLPVGFGGYHWLAVDRTGSRWFVTVSDLAAPWVPDLSAAMQTAAWLAGDAGLEFVVAPVPTREGLVVGYLNSQHALTLFPYLDAAPSHFDDAIDDADRNAIIDMLAALHAAAPASIQLPSRPLELANLLTVEQALASLDVPWNGGPYAEPGRELLTQYERSLRQALAQFDSLLDRVRKADGPYVITHGEPHPGVIRSANVSRTAPSRLGLDRAGPARAGPVVGDLRRSRRRPILAADRVGGQPGRAGPLPAALGPGRHSGIPVQIRGPHQETADTLTSWEALRETLAAIAKMG